MAGYVLGNKTAHALLPVIYLSLFYWSDNMPERGIK